MTPLSLVCLTSLSVSAYLRCIKMYPYYIIQLSLQFARLAGDSGTLGPHVNSPERKNYVEERVFARFESIHLYHAEPVQTLYSIHGR